MQTVGKDVNLEVIFKQLFSERPIRLG